VVYTSVDQAYSEPILKAFQTRTGIEVRPLFDVEASKTVGLANRLVAERARPHADVFWNGEFAQTLLLKERGVLALYDSPEARDIPSAYRDPEHFWTGLAARARVLLVNTDLVPRSERPVSILDLLDPRRPGERLGVANPLFGTTATHAAALHAALGADPWRAFFQGLQQKGVRVVDGNSVVRDLVASGQLLYGLTDTDDACGAIARGAPVEMILPDQSEGAMGAFVIPGTVALIAGAPHREEAERLIDYLLSSEVEARLVESGWCQIPVRPVEARSRCPAPADIRTLPVDLAAVYQQLEPTKRELVQIFVR
jgi:iron(III) transport system substrate-binding protein